jgi:Protein of unknown function (DUF2924)
VTGIPRPASDREAIEVEIDRVRSLGLDELRTLWRLMFRSSPPPAFTKDLMARFLCWHIQEQAFGGLDAETAMHLDGLGQGNKPGADRLRRLKPGTLLLREYQGERHTVTIVANGYVWRETIYASLSTIARAITGTSWNGPRFFGLRSQPLRQKRPMCRRHQTTSDVLFGRPSRRRLALHNILVTALLQHLSSMMGSADHEAYRSQAPTLRDLHPQIDRA